MKHALILLSCLMLIAAPAVAAQPPTVANPAARQALFGDLHLHTSFSFDAWGWMGVKTTPDEALRFARGEPVIYKGRRVTRTEAPLDFVALTDHSEFFGVLKQLDDPNSDFSKSAIGQKFRGDPQQAFAALDHARNLGQPIPGFNPDAAIKAAWREEIEAVKNNYQPGKFTTFLGYEWTFMPHGYNLHRNVIFDGDDPPLPFSSQNVKGPEDLWSYMEKVRAGGLDVIDIPHNSNASNGLMFDWSDSFGRPIDAAYARRRMLNEPIAEMYQNKGQSETLPELSPEDPDADFRVMDRLLTAAQIRSKPHGSYLREAEGRGLLLQRMVGVNPFKVGFVGGSDFHNGLSLSAEEDFAGGNFGVPSDVFLPTQERGRKILAPPSLSALFGNGTASGPVLSSPDVAPFPVNNAGLTGVWADRNDRPSIFAAFRRKEVFATSGTRISVRLFGGWDYSPALLAHADWVSEAYNSGVPMGGDLPVAPGAAKAPRFVVWAAKDPRGANLDRVQIIKVWLQGDGYKEEVFEVAHAGNRTPDRITGRVPSIGNTVNLKTATYQNTIGAAELAVVWQDPKFDPSQPALYYARALEIPTPNWTTVLAVKLGLPLATSAPATIQERAATSPIWYAPAKVAGD
jgi:hypothetical protein